MPDLVAERRLVKSPPELWAELSELDRLAQHLDAFGEIRITKLEPETSVAWEGEHARGSVSIEPSGWGTKVTLKAAVPEPPAPEPEPEPEAEGEPEPVLQAEPEPEPEPALHHTAPGPEPEAESEPKPQPTEESPALELPAETAPDRRGFFVRLFRRLWLPEETPETAPTPVDAEPVGAEPEAEPDFELEPEPDAPTEPEAVVEPEPPDEPEPEPEPEAAAEPGTEPERGAEPQPYPDPARPGLDPDEVQAVLDGMLDTLGAAHHRPFSRS